MTGKLAEISVSAAFQILITPSARKEIVARGRGVIGKGEASANGVSDALSHALPAISDDGPQILISFSAAAQHTMTKDQAIAG
jgi:hypothetical protein